MSAFEEHWAAQRQYLQVSCGVSQVRINAIEGFAVDVWNAALDALEGPSGVGAIPETTDYANGWNDCRQRMFAQYKARIAELRE